MGEEGGGLRDATSCRFPFFQGLGNTPRNIAILSAKSEEAEVRGFQ